MTAILKRLGLLSASLLTFTGGMAWNGETGPATFADLYSSAEARVGRPMTPVSYAGVARRTTRRTVYRGAAASGAYAYPPPVVVAQPYPPACVTVVDSYGRSYQRC